MYYRALVPGTQLDKGRIAVESGTEVPGGSLDFNRHRAAGERT